MTDKLLVIDAAAMGYDLLVRHGSVEAAGLTFRPAETVFPAVTCTVQASFRTARPPADHGMVANGLFHRALRRAMFWEQSSGLVAGERIWSAFRRRGRKVAMLFWQQSMGEDVDMLMTPAPIHKHHGGMIQDCYCKPDDLYARICSTGLMKPFKLRTYWGPTASENSGLWIADAANVVLSGRVEPPDLCLVYLPTLDYALQRHGPDGARAGEAVASLRMHLENFVPLARRKGYEVVVFGDYAIAEVTRPAALPNLALRQAGLMRTRTVRGMCYPDFHASRAFAVVDHEVAHVYVPDPADVAEARRVLAAAPGVGEVLGGDAPAGGGLDHPNAGELLIVAGEGSWLAYPWWTDRKEAPDYAAHVDIHNKPGYDPCELFFGWPPMTVSRDTSKVRGTHGRAGPGRQIAWASTIDFDPPPATLLDLAAAVRGALDGDHD